MNEIEKLKTEHARYRKALEEIASRYAPIPAAAGVTFAYQSANNALNTPPVTLDELKAALRYYRDANGSHSVNFYQDESGCIRDVTESRVYSFATLREAVDFLNR